MAVRNALIVGAGIAGSTCAFFLGRAGISTTVVERASGRRSSGGPVDVRGPALDVIQEMGVLNEIRAAATHTARLVAVDAEGRAIAWIPTQLSGEAVEISRSDLAAVLTSAGSEQAEYLFDDTVTQLQQDGDGVDVMFERAAPCRFDVVVGADGLHSTVRRLVFGPEAQFVTHLGLYLATVTLDREAADRRSVLIHNEPGRALVLHPGTGTQGAGFFFRHPALPAGYRNDPRMQKELVAATYAGMGWQARELVAHLRGSDDIYFDAVSKVRLERWSNGQVVLVGDAADCVSLFGEGSSMAIAGAATLATAINDQHRPLATALWEYERTHRHRLAPHQSGVWAAAHLLVPSTGAGLHARNTLFRTSAAAIALRQRFNGRPA